MVQELLNYMGSFIRSDPKMFDGIMRLRTHYIIIALREEISRMKGCDEEAAVDYLMQVGDDYHHGHRGGCSHRESVCEHDVVCLVLQLPPYELKMLLGTILSGPNLSTCNIYSVIRDQTTGQSAGSWRNVNLNVSPSVDQQPNLGDLSQLTKMTVIAQSAGYSSGNFARIEINNVRLPVASRGLNVVVVDPFDGVIADTTSFDTHWSETDSNDFAKFLDWMDPGMIIVVCCKDDCVEHLTQDARRALQALGSEKVSQLQYRDSWCLVAEKGWWLLCWMRRAALHMDA